MDPGPNMGICIDSAEGWFAANGSRRIVSIKNNARKNEDQFMEEQFGTHEIRKGARDRTVRFLRFLSS